MGFSWAVSSFCASTAFNRKGKQNKHRKRSLYPTRLKIWFRTEAKAPAIGAIESSPLLEIGTRFNSPIPGLWLGLKSKFSITLGIFLPAEIAVFQKRLDQKQNKYNKIFIRMFRCRFWIQKNRYILLA